DRAGRRRHPARGDGRHLGRCRRGPPDAGPIRPRGRPVVLGGGRRDGDRRARRARPRAGRSGVRRLARRAGRSGDCDGGGAMKLGLSLPQGCDREYLGVDPVTAWRRTVEVARFGEDLGFDSLWINDHMQVDPPPEEAIIFEPFAELAALAVETKRAQLGHLVLSASYRNPGLTAKAISTIDVISGGRAILGIGAGWKEDEWLAYGYGFPPARERLAVLADQLEIITRMLGPG